MRDLTPLPAMETKILSPQWQHQQCLVCPEQSGQEQSSPGPEVCALPAGHHARSTPEQIDGEKNNENMTVRGLNLFSRKQISYWRLTTKPLWLEDYRSAFETMAESTSVKVSTRCKENLKIALKLNKYFQLNQETTIIWRQKESAMQPWSFYVVWSKTLFMCDYVSVISKGQRL